MRLVNVRVRPGPPNSCVSKSLKSDGRTCERRGLRRDRGVLRSLKPVATRDAALLAASWPVQHAPRLRVRVLSVANDQRGVHEHVLHAERHLMWLLER